MRVLRTVATAHRHDEPGDDAPVFQACGVERRSDDVGDQGIGRHEDMSAGHHDPRCAAAETLEKFIHVFEIGGAQGSEARKGRTPAAIEGWRHSPDPTFALEELALFFFRVFDQAVGRVRHDGVNAVLAAIFQPLEAVRLIQRRLAVNDYGLGGFAYFLDDSGHAHPVSRIGGRRLCPLHLNVPGGGERRGR